MQLTHKFQLSHFVEFFNMLNEILGINKINKA